jgi:hypothetical protein
MTKTSIDEILSLLRDKKRDREESMQSIEDSIKELRMKLNRIEGNLYEIDYMIEYIEASTIC